MGLEDIFQQSAEEWTKHCRKNSHHSDIESYLDCDAYRKIVSSGPQILPLIRNQLSKEYEIAIRYETELKRIKQKVFGDENIFLYRETYYKICEDEEYKEYSKGYHKDVLGKPGFRWGYAVSEIISDFGLPIKKIAEQLLKILVQAL
jgi:hypothetical protein